MGNISGKASKHG